MLKQILEVLGNPLVLSGIGLLCGIIFAKKKYQKYVAIAYLLVHCIENADTNDKVKKFVASLVKGDLKKELDDVLAVLNYKDRGEKSLEQIDREHFDKKFPELKLKI